MVKNERLCNGHAPETCSSMLGKLSNFQIDAGYGHSVVYSFITKKCLLYFSLFDTLKFETVSVLALSRSRGCSHRIKRNNSTTHRIQGYV